MKRLVILGLVVVGCASPQITFETFPAREEVPVGEFARIKIPDCGDDWKMQDTLRVADHPNIAHVNFAGRFQIISVSCGTGCLEYCVIDRKTGVVHLQEHSFEQNFPSEWDGPGGMLFRPDSRLLTVNWAGGFDWPVHVDHYLWDGGKMKLVKQGHIQKPAGAPSADFMTFGIRPIDLITRKRPNPYHR